MREERFLGFYRKGDMFGGFDWRREGLSSFKGHMGGSENAGTKTFVLLGNKISAQNVFLLLHRQWKCSVGLYC